MNTSVQIVIHTVHSKLITNALVLLNVCQKACVCLQTLRTATKSPGANKNQDEIFVESIFSRIIPHPAF